MKAFKIRGEPIEPHVRAKLAEHTMVDKIQERYGLPREQAERLVGDSVITAMEMLGSRYTTHMTEVVTHLTHLREAIHLVYEKALSGSPDPIDRQATLRMFEELHATTKELADPKTWAEGPGQEVEPLTAAAVEYPGARVGLADKPSHAPRHGDPVPGGKPGQTWEVKTKRPSDITLEFDAEGFHRKWPELKAGEVLHFPDYGYRVWMEPGGAIVEELVVGPSVSSTRGFTRGEDVMFSAADMGGAFEEAGTQRAHGVGPGLGFDAPYGVAHAVARINNWLENNGVEAWVRQLRDNAPPGVEYVWTARTRKSGQKLAQRQYTISAIVEGKVNELYAFEVSVGKGAPNVDAPIDFDVVGVTPEAEIYGMPYTKRSLAAYESAAPGQEVRPERLDPPEVVSRALGRTRSTERTINHPANVRTGERIQALTRILDSTILDRAVSAGDPAWSSAIDDLTSVVGRLDDRLRTRAPDPERLARIDLAITRFNRRARWSTPADLLALARELRTLLGGER